MIKADALHVPEFMQGFCPVREPALEHKVVREHVCIPDESKNSLEPPHRGRHVAWIQTIFAGSYVWNAVMNFDILR